MRLRSHLIVIASATVFAFAGANAFAQGAPGGAAGSGATSPSTGGSAGQSGSGGATSSPSTKGAGAGADVSGSATKGAGANTASQGPWTSDNVTAARPFGELNITAAGTTNQSVSSWAQQRTPAERAEIMGRCEVITNAQNSSRFMPDAVAFCRTYMMTASANPPGGKASGKATP